MDISISYDDFKQLCRVHDHKGWLFGFDVRQMGVFVDPPDPELPPSELAAISWHPSGDLSEPVLKFPTSLEELQRFLEESGGYGCIDPFDIADFVLSRISSAEDIPLARAAIGKFRRPEREDPLASEIQAALEQAGDPTLSEVIRILDSFTGKGGSCIHAVSASEGVTWRKSDGELKTLTRKALQQRLNRLKMRNSP